MLGTPTTFRHGVRVHDNYAIWKPVQMRIHINQQQEG